MRALVRDKYPERRDNPIAAKSCGSDRREYSPERVRQLQPETARRLRRHADPRPDAARSKHPRQPRQKPAKSAATAAPAPRTPRQPAPPAVAARDKRMAKRVPLK